MKNRNIIVSLFAVGCFGLSPVAQAACPSPNQGCGNNNTADGQNALLSLTTGTYNTAVGSESLKVLTNSSFCTAVGAGALFANTAGVNTAVGAAALLLNTSGNNNTALGAAALLNNTEGFQNTAIGGPTLFGNTLGSNTEGDSNTAIGAGALLFSTGNSNIAVGVSTGLGVTSANDVICIGAVGQNVDNSCYIGNIHGASVDLGTNQFVRVDANGKLGTAAVDANGNRVEGLEPQAMLRKIEELQATVAQLTIQLKEQADQIQKVSAQVEMSKPATKVASSDP